MMKSKILVCLFVGLLLAAAASSKTDKKKKTDVEEAVPETLQILDNIQLDIEAKLSSKCNHEKKGKCSGEETAEDATAAKKEKKTEESGKEDVKVKDKKNKQSKQEEEVVVSDKTESKNAKCDGKQEKCQNNPENKKQNSEKSCNADKPGKCNHGVQPVASEKTCKGKKAEECKGQETAEKKQKKTVEPCDEKKAKCAQKEEQVNAVQTIEKTCSACNCKLNPTGESNGQKCDCQCHKQANTPSQADAASCKKGSKDQQCAEKSKKQSDCPCKKEGAPAPAAAAAAADKEGETSEKKCNCKACSCNHNKQEGAEKKSECQCHKQAANTAIPVADSTPNAEAVAEEKSCKGKKADKKCNSKIEDAKTPADETQSTGKCNAHVTKAKVIEKQDDVVEQEVPQAVSEKTCKGSASASKCSKTKPAANYTEQALARASKYQFWTQIEIEDIEKHHTGVSSEFTQKVNCNPVSLSKKQDKLIQDPQQNIDNFCQSKASAPTTDGQAVSLDKPETNTVGFYRFFNNGTACEQELSWNSTEKGSFKFSSSPSKTSIACTASGSNWQASSSYKLEKTFNSRSEIFNQTNKIVQDNGADNKVTLAYQEYQEDTIELHIKEVPSEEDAQAQNYINKTSKKEILVHTGSFQREEVNNQTVIASEKKWKESQKKIDYLENTAQGQVLGSESATAKNQQSQKKVNNTIVSSSGSVQENSNVYIQKVDGSVDYIDAGNSQKWKQSTEKPEKNANPEENSWSVSGTYVKAAEPTAEKQKSTAEASKSASKKEKSSKQTKQGEKKEEKATDKKSKSKKEEQPSKDKKNKSEQKKQNVKIDL